MGRAFPQADNDTLGSVLLNQLMLGTRIEIRTHPLMLGVDNFAEALRIARLIEDQGYTNRVLNAFEGIRKSPVDIRYESEDKGDRLRGSVWDKNRSPSRDMRDKDEGRSSWNRGRSPESSPYRSNTYRQESFKQDKQDYNRGNSSSPRGRPITCCYCDKPGHLGQDCKMKKPVLECRYCGKGGHVTEDCWAKQRVEGIRRGNEGNTRGNAMGVNNKFETSRGGYSNEDNRNKWQPNKGYLNEDTRNKFQNDAYKFQRDKVNTRGDTLCFKCQKTGHLMRSCPLLQGTVFRDNRMASPNTSDGKRVSFMQPMNGMQFDDVREDFNERELDDDSIERMTTSEIQRAYIRKARGRKDFNDMFAGNQEDELHTPPDTSGIPSVRLEELETTDIDREQDGERSNEITLDRVRTVLSNPEANGREVTKVLGSLITLAVEPDELESIVPLLQTHFYYQSPHAETIKLILQKRGHHLRRNPLTDRWVEIRVDTGAGERIIVHLHARSKVKKLRKLIYEQWPEEDNALMLIWIWEQAVDDDEYLLDCGCATKKVNVVYASWVSTGVELQRPWKGMASTSYEDYVEGNTSTTPACVQHFTANEADYYEANEPTRETDMDKDPEPHLDYPRQDEWRDDTLLDSGGEEPRQTRETYPRQDTWRDEALLASDGDEPVRTSFLDLLNGPGMSTTVTQTTPKTMREQDIQTMIKRGRGRPKRDELPGMYCESRRERKERLENERGRINSGGNEIIDDEPLEQPTNTDPVREPIDVPQTSTQRTTMIPDSVRRISGNRSKPLAPREASPRNDDQRNQGGTTERPANVSKKKDDVASSSRNMTDSETRRRPSLGGISDIVQEAGEWVEVIDRLSTRVHTRGNGSGNSTMMLMMIMMLMMTKLPTTGTLTAYDCDKPKQGPRYSLRDLEQCPEAVPSKVTRSDKVVYYVYQESDFLRTTARECIVKRAQTAWYCGRGSYTAMVVPKTAYRPIRILSHNCEAAFQTGKVRIEGELFVEARVGTIIDERIVRAGSVKEDGTCTVAAEATVNGMKVTSAVVIEDYNVELREYQVTFDSVTGKMMDRPHCTSSHTVCFTGTSTIIYKVNVHQCSLTLLKQAEFIELKGYQYQHTEMLGKISIKPREFRNSVNQSNIPTSATPTVIMARSTKIMLRFVLKDDALRCGTTVQRTNYPNIYVSKKLIQDGAVKVLREDADLSKYFNNKIDYLYHLQLLTMEQFYEEVVSNDCRLNREIIRTKLAIALTNQDVVAPVLSLQEGTYARVMGEVIHTYQCRKVEVNLATVDYCTNELPVMYNGVLMFAKPITRILLSHAAKIDPSLCSNLLSPIYEWKTGIWITVPHRHKVPKPLTIELIKLSHEQAFHDIDNVGESGLYKQADLDAARRYVLFPEQRARVLTEMVYKAMKGGKQEPDFELLLSPDHFKKATVATMEKIWGRFLIFGQASAGLMGIYIIGVIIKILLSQVLNTLHIYKFVGLSWKMVLGCCPLMARHVLFELNLDALRKRQSERWKREDGEERDKCVELIRSDNTNIQTSGEVHYPDLDSIKEEGKKVRINYMHCMVDEEMIWLNVDVGGQNVIALVDTGSPITMIGQGCLNANQLRRMKKSDELLWTGSNTLIAVVGSFIETCIIDAALVKVLIACEIRIIKDGPVKCVLGLDIIKVLQERGINWFIVGRRRVKLDITHYENPEEERAKKDDEIRVRPVLPCVMTLKQGEDFGIDKGTNTSPEPKKRKVISVKHYLSSTSDSEDEDSPVDKDKDLREECRSITREIERLGKDQGKRWELLSRRCLQLEDQLRTRNNPFIGMLRSNKGTRLLEPINKRFIIRIYINGKMIRALLDTGSDISIVAAKLLTKEQRREARTKEETYSTITGEDVTFNNIVEIPMMVSGHCCPSEFRIMESPVEDCIIGVDVLDNIMKEGIEWIRIRGRMQRQINEIISDSNDFYWSEDENERHLSIGMLTRSKAMKEPLKPINQRFEVMTCINNTWIRTLLDTGAAVSIVARRILTLQQQANTREIENVYYTVTGEAVTFMELVDLNITVSGCDIKAEFRIMDNLEEGCIIGTDLLGKIMDEGIEWIRDAGRMQRPLHTASTLMELYSSHIGEERPTVGMLGPMTKMYGLVVEINGKSVVATMDTGSPISILTERMLTIQQAREMAWDPCPYYTITGQQIPLIGWVEIPVKKGGTTFNAVFRVILNMENDCIIGSDMLDQMTFLHIDWVPLERWTKEPYINMIRMGNTRYIEHVVHEQQVAELESEIHRLRRERNILRVQLQDMKSGTDLAERRKANRERRKQKNSVT